jgi:hypothetical protein
MSTNDAGLEFLVATVAEDRLGAVFATAEVCGFGFRGIELYGREFGAFVAAVAEGLAGAQAAGAPEIAFAGFDFNSVGTLLGNGWFGHGEFSLKQV